MTACLRCRAKCEYWSAFVVALISASSCSTAQASWPTITFPPVLADGRDDCALVQGQVLEQGRKGSPAKATIKVLNVYSGPQELLNSKFIDLAVSARSASSPEIACPLYHVEEIALWCLSRTKDGWKVTFRFRELSAWHSQRYPHMLEQAEMIERLTKLPKDRRYSLAKDLCEHQTPEIAALAVRYIGRHLDGLPNRLADEKARSADALAFLQQLAANSRVALHTLCKVDDLLLDSHSVRKEEDIAKQWRRSDARKRLIERLKSPTTTEETRAAFNRWFELERDWAIELLEALLNNPRIARSTSLEVLKDLGAIAHGDRVVDPVFNALVGMIRRVDDDPPVRLEAARWLGMLGTMPEDPDKRPLLRLSYEQVKILRALAMAEKDKEFAKALNEALERH